MRGKVQEQVMVGGQQAHEFLELACMGCREMTGVFNLNYHLAIDEHVAVSDKGIIPNYFSSSLLNLHLQEFNTVAFNVLALHLQMFALHSGIGCKPRG